MLIFTPSLKWVPAKGRNPFSILRRHIKRPARPYQLISEISSKGTDKALLDKIAMLAADLKQSEVSQENSKAGRPLLTIETIVKLNRIYDQAIAICQIASLFMKDCRRLKCCSASLRP